MSGVHLTGSFPIHPWIAAAAEMTWLSILHGPQSPKPVSSHSLLRFPYKFAEALNGMRGIASASTHNAFAKPWAQP